MGTVIYNVNIDNKLIDNTLSISNVKIRKYFKKNKYFVCNGIPLFLRTHQHCITIYRVYGCPLLVSSWWGFISSNTKNFLTNHSKTNWEIQLKIFDIHKLKNSGKMVFPLTRDKILIFPGLSSAIAQKKELWFGEIVSSKKETNNAAGLSIRTLERGGADKIQFELMTKFFVFLNLLVTSYPKMNNQYWNILNYVFFPAN